MTETASADGDLKRTPLHELHQSLGARMTPFAGYDMPLQYPLGVMKEHLHVRERAGLFDVSHMGQVVIRAKSGDPADAARALEALMPVDLLALTIGRQRYGLLTNDAGGVIDDLMAVRRAVDFLLVVNASRKDVDLVRLREGLGADCEIEPLGDRALIALQGPASEAALSHLAPECVGLRFMDAAAIEILGAPCFVTRSGYTGEDGFEISMPAGRAVDVARALLADDLVEPIGLGARDSLRLEAGLCLYGNELTEETTPVEAALEWAIQKSRRRGGAREGGFPGAERILAELENGAPRRRVGLRPEGRAPVRGGATLFEQEEGGEAIGQVTSGVFGPSLGAPIAMGYAPAALSEPGQRIFAELRGRREPVEVVAMPAVPASFNR